MNKNSVRIVVVIAVAAVFCVVLVAKARQPAKTEAQRGDICEARNPAAQPISPSVPQPVSAPQIAQPQVGKGLPTVLDFGRGTCIPCKAMKPILDELKKELAGKVEIRIVDTGEDEATADKFNIQLIPTQVFLNASGKEVYRHEGFLPKEDILAKLREMGMK